MFLSPISTRNKSLSTDLILCIELKKAGFAVCFLINNTFTTYCTFLKTMVYAICFLLYNRYHISPADSALTDRGGGEANAN